MVDLRALDASGISRVCLTSREAVYLLPFDCGWQVGIRYHREGKPVAIRVHMPEQMPEQYKKNDDQKFLWGEVRRQFWGVVE